jgi:CHASE2 domain-containing sensor protein
MEKWVTLTLEGNIETQGCQAILEIGIEQHQPDCQVSIPIPPAPDLIQALKAWRHSYLNLRLLTRLKPKAILYAGSVNLDDCHRAAHTLHDEFAAWLSSDALRSLDLRLREELSRDHHIRVLIRSSNGDIQHLPWHLWDLFERYPHAEVALGTPTFEQIKSPQLRQSQAGVRILAVLGHQEGIDVERDRQLLADLPNATIEFLVEPDRQTVNDHLWDQSWDILFFAGHSTTEGEKGRIYLNPNDSFTLTELKYGLKRSIAQGLQIAIFNSCDGLGLAHELKQLGLPHMIIMREPVPDRVAQEFLKHFLMPFAQGESLYQAERLARERLQGLEQTFPCASWLPVIYQTSTAPPPTWNSLCGVQDTLSPAPSTDAKSPSLSLQLRLLSAIALSLLSTIVVAGLRAMGLLQYPELQAYDQLMQRRPAETPTDRVLVVTATEADLVTYGYPLSDDVLAAAIQKLIPYQPRVIGLDIFRDRLQTTHPLYSQFEQFDRLIALCSVGQLNDPDRPGIPPPPGLSEEQIGFSNVVVDPDAVLRRQLLFMHPESVNPCTTRVSLNMAIAVYYLQEDNIVPETLEDQRMQLGQATFNPLGKHAGAYHNLEYWGFQVLFNPPTPFENSTIQQISLSDLLNDDFEFDTLQNTAVLIGITAPISNPTDYFLTSTGATQWPRQTTPGVILQAQMVDFLIKAAMGEENVIQVWKNWQELLWIAAWACVGAGLALWIRPTPWKMLGVGVSVLSLYGLCWGLILIGFWVPLVPAAIALILSSVGIVMIDSHILRRVGVFSKTLPNEARSNL